MRLTHIQFTALIHSGIPNNIKWTKAKYKAFGANAFQILSYVKLLKMSNVLAVSNVLSESALLVCDCLSGISSMSNTLAMEAAVLSFEVLKGLTGK